MSRNDLEFQVWYRFLKVIYIFSFVLVILLVGLLVLVLKPEEKIGGWLFSSILAFGLVWLLFRVIKILFFYIATGEKPTLTDFKRLI